MPKLHVLDVFGYITGIKLLNFESECVCMYVCEGLLEQDYLHMF